MLKYFCKKYILFTNDFQTEVSNIIEANYVDFAINVCICIRNDYVKQEQANNKKLSD